MQPQTHTAIDHRLCGTPEALDAGRATVRMRATPEMTVDAEGLVHGGFVFGLADHAAMLAVNHPHVVLGAAEMRFLAPVAVGSELLATADVTETKGRKRTISVTVNVGDRVVFVGTLTALVLEGHVLRS